uniref:Uncharacterized protein n=1 Tax=Sus scrofa TaxID=9823 RepID=A0A8D1S2U7_PIG
MQSPAVLVTSRRVQNVHTGLDLTVPQHQEVRGRMMSGHVEYQILAVTRLAAFKSAKHRPEDVVQFLAPDRPVPRISAAETALSWTQTAKQGTTGMLLTSSSSRTRWRVKACPPWARRARMQGSPRERRRRRRPWTLWASCGRSPLPGGPWSISLQAPPSLLGV